MFAAAYKTAPRRPVEQTYSDVTVMTSVAPIENKPTSAWWLGFGIAVFLLLNASRNLSLGLDRMGRVWVLGDVNKTVMWGWDITNFVFWVGIGHAGTLISAILLLFRQKWRMSINRSAEAMTIFAVLCAAHFHLFHMGRVWLAYWALPLPNAFGSLWVNFNSPLLMGRFCDIDLSYRFLLYSGT